MDEQKLSIGNFIMSAIATIFHFAFGGWSMALVCLIALTIVDYLTGMAVAVKKGGLDSTRGRQGFITKCLYFVLIATLHLVDKGLGLPYPVLMTIGSWNLLIVEGISIVENLSEFGVPIPEQLRETFKRLKDKKHDIDI